jgi:hypothetical protein
MFDLAGRMVRPGEIRDKRKMPLVRLYLIEHER